MQKGEPLTLIMEDEQVTVGIDLNDKTGIRINKATVRSGRRTPSESGTNIGKLTSTSFLHISNVPCANIPTFGISTEVSPIHSDKA